MLNRTCHSCVVLKRENIIWCDHYLNKLVIKGIFWSHCEKGRNNAHIIRVYKCLHKYRKRKNSKKKAIIPVGNGNFVFALKLMYSTGLATSAAYKFVLLPIVVKQHSLTSWSMVISAWKWNHDRLYVYLSWCHKIFIILILTHKEN